MSTARHATASIRFEDMMKIFLPPVNPASFGAVFPQDKIRKIHLTFKAAVWEPREHAAGAYADSISEAWLALDRKHPLCMGYVLHLFENDKHPEDGKHEIDHGALISLHDKNLLEEEGCPNWFHDDLSIEFEHDEGDTDIWNDRAVNETEADGASWTVVRGRLLSYHAERIFLVQHRTALFMLFVNGGQFRVIRWDRSGCIVTEALNYVDTVEGTERLLCFLYAYSQASPEQRGFDTTATLLPRDSCGWQWMRKVAIARPRDLDHTDAAEVGSIPDGFAITPAGKAIQSPLFAASILSPDPSAAGGSAESFSDSTATAHIIPVFRYVRDLFRKSVPPNWPCYCLKVCGGYYLVGKPIFEPHGLVGRGTRGYVALEWTTQRLVFLKDTWRPIYHGIDEEGTTLENLNKAGVSFVPTLICHEDVGLELRRQETVASEYLKKKPAVFEEQRKNDRLVAPIPSCPSNSTKQNTSVSEGKPPADVVSLDPPSGEQSRKRARPQKTAPPALRDISDLRRLGHYRIVVAEVCLPSTAITGGEQLARIIWHCVIAHRDAAVDCDVLYRDISAGNILILPTVVCMDPERGQWGVLWVGTMCDWELAMPIPAAQEKPQVGQPHRMGTWYYMSVHSLIHPERPVSISIADELESFFHVLLYLAVRLLRTTPVDVGLFINRYFASSEQDQFGRGHICGALKQEVVRSGLLEWHGAAIHFLSQGPEEATARFTPLNDLVARLLEYFKARYAILCYETQTATAPPPPSVPPFLRESVISARAQNLNAAFLRAKGKLPGGATSSRAPDVAGLPPRFAASDVVQKPSDDVYELAAALETHGSVLALFEEISCRSWPLDDYVGDQLDEGYDSRRVTSQDEEGPSRWEQS